MSKSTMTAIFAVTCGVLLAALISYGARYAYDYYKLKKSLAPGA